MTPMPEQGLPVAKIAAEPKKAIDWERVEIDFRAGRMTLREIGAKHGVAHPSILKRAKRDSWDRDLQGKISAADTGTGDRLNAHERRALFYESRLEACDLRLMPPRFALGKPLFAAGA